MYVYVYTHKHRGIHTFMCTHAYAHTQNTKQYQLRYIKIKSHKKVFESQCTYQLCIQHTVSPQKSSKNNYAIKKSLLNFVIAAPNIISLSYTQR